MSNGKFGIFACNMIKTPPLNMKKTYELQGYVFNPSIVQLRVQLAIVWFLNILRATKINQ